MRAGVLQVMIGAALLLIVLLLGFALSGVWVGKQVVGDGRDPESYGFDLTNLNVARTSLQASGNPRDFLLPLNHPQMIGGAEVLDYNARNRPKYLVTTDRVVGVTLNGASRAYPLRLLNAHEIINDTLAGNPIAVTYSPFCDSVVVFDSAREGTARIFRVSGLLCNANLVIYDATATEGAHSLYSQLLMRAIAGPEAGALASASPTQLRAIPGVSVCAWETWFAAHPETTVALPALESARRMKAISYERYFDSSHLAWPCVSPITGAAMELADPKRPCLVRVDSGGVQRQALDGKRIEYLLPDSEADVLVIPGLRFALGSFFPDDEPVPAQRDPSHSDR